MLKVTGDVRKASLDMRLIDPELNLEKLQLEYRIYNQQQNVWKSEKNKLEKISRFWKIKLKN